MEKYRVGVTGHRKLIGKKEQVFEATKNLLWQIAQDQRFVERGVEVNTGMALGFDQLVCVACIDLSIPYVAVVPCDGQDALWPEAQRQLYAELLSSASRVVQVTPGPYEPWKMHARNGWIVNNSDQMVVHWDGIWKGGTASCMKLVNSKKLAWVNTVVPRQEPSRLVCHR